LTRFQSTGTRVISYNWKIIKASERSLNESKTMFLSTKAHIHNEIVKYIRLLKVQLSAEKFESHK